ncbi:MAG TPA: hypothetical protein VE998_04815, partial [Terriglobales bacterium]|nr:hypothetical protein [Terriglobales bacterium]
FSAGSGTRPVPAADPAATPQSAPTLASVSMPAVPLHESSAQGLQVLQKSYRPALEKLVAELGPQANMVPYAPPAFITFRNGTYLQVSVTTTSAQPSNASQYQLAALAFDSHISHLIRPVLSYFSNDVVFDGIDFSTTVMPGGERAQAVEFVVPMPVARCYAAYDCTGQQLIEKSFVLINGERVSLDLQTAEQLR